jgi:hypothetical protein
MIKPIQTKASFPIEIDLTGPDGNVFNLISIAMNLGKQLNKTRGTDYFDVKAIQKDMMSDDYEHAIEVLEREFGDKIIMYR